MKLFLQIEISNWQQSGYGSLLVNYASSLSSNIMGTDLDSQSEPLIADLVLRLIDQSEKIFLFVRATDPNLSLGVANKVFSQLAKSKEKIAAIVLCGDHRTAESALTELPFFSKESDKEKIKSLILDFSEVSA